MLITIGEVFVSDVDGSTIGIDRKIDLAENGVDK